MKNKNLNFADCEVLYFGLDQMDDAGVIEVAEHIDSGGELLLNGAVEKQGIF